MLERIFRLRANNTSLRTEVIAGITTFMTMAYIIFVDPTIVQAARWWKQIARFPCTD
jgi:AGZA family xanthine/uracil permease-like MFS transporter